MEGSDPQTLILAGKTGSGKSATGNSIIGNKKFRLNRLFSGGTTTSKLETRELEDGQMLNVIDTPGLLFTSLDHGTIRDIISCIKLPIDGIHAVLVVFSVSDPVFEEDKAVISSLPNLFGKIICDYMIVVLTGGDELEEDGKTLEDFLCGFPQPLKDILFLCGNRYVLFDNKTNDETKKSKQLHQLLSLVNMVLEKNGGEPYTNEAFTVMKMEKMLTNTSLKFEQELLAARLKFEQELLVEQAARLKLEENTKKIEQELRVEQAARLKIEQELLVEQAARLKIEHKLLVEQAARLKLEENTKKIEQELRVEQAARSYISPL